MGIPHLTTFLRPYAGLGTLAGRNVVIDGPGLAYHIYYLCLSRRPLARSPFEAAPTYEEIGKASIEWLNALETSGAIIKKIYFDGYLPQSKLEVRLERLTNLTKKLTNYYYANPVPCRAPLDTEIAPPINLFDTGPVRAGLTTITPAPFLVPAVLDTLKSSERYSRVTIVVPGEADLYCATYLSEHGGVVLTGDSDLLVHDLGLDGAVCLYKDLEATSDSDLVLTSCHMYHPSIIADRLVLPKPHGLRALAFEMLQDTHGTFKKLLGQAVSLKSIKANESKYREFCKEYSIPTTSLSHQSKVSHVDEQIELLEALQRLDPRISEFVLQSPSLAKVAGHEFLNSDSHHIFLPFLLDCPVRTNAWETSTSMRQLAYGLINLIVPDDQRWYSVFEHRRQQQNSNGREWQVPNVAEIPDACSALVTLFDQISAKVADLSSLDLWTAVAIYQDTEYSISHEKQNVTDLALQQLCNIQNHHDIRNDYSWDIIQFIAQIEGTYYSFRILKQIIGLLLVHSRRKQFPPSVILLQDRLITLPSLEVRPGYGIHYSLTQLHDMRSFLSFAHDILGVEHVQSRPEASRKRKRKRKKNTDHAPEFDQANIHNSSNPFDLLANE